VTLSSDFRLLFFVSPPRPCVSWLTEWAYSLCSVCPPFFPGVFLFLRRFLSNRAAHLKKGSFTALKPLSFETLRTISDRCWTALPPLSPRKRLPCSAHVPRLHHFLRAYWLNPKWRTLSPLRTFCIRSDSFLPHRVSPAWRRLVFLRCSVRLFTSILLLISWFFSGRG